VGCSVWRFSGACVRDWQQQGIVVANGKYYDRQGKQLDHYANYLQNAYAEMQLAHYAAAVSLFEQALAINPQDRAATWGRALAQAKQEIHAQYPVAVPVTGRQQNAQLAGEDLVSFPVITEEGTRVGYLRRDTGSWVISPRFDEAGSFHDGLARIKDKGKYGFVRLDGTFAVKPDYDWTWFYFKDGLTSVQFHGSYGFVDTNGRLVVKPQFGYALLYSEGLARVSYNGNYGYIDKQGKFVIPPRYEFASDFTEGLAPVEMDRKWGFINKAGQLVIPCLYENSLAKFSEGLANVKLNGKYGFIDQTGKMVITAQYDYAESFHDGQAIVQNNGLYGVIDRQGRFVVPPRYDLVSGFIKGIAKVKLKDRFGYINRTGQEIVPVQFERVEYFPQQAVIEVYGSHLWGILNTNGTWIEGPVSLNAQVDQYWPKQKILLVQGYYFGQGTQKLLDHYVNHMKSAYWHAQQGDNLRAMHSFGAALKINPGDAAALWGLIQIRAKEIYFQSGLD
jgi:tetratricopeptide (TPR) repeat protein